jgi:hypothetical protein
MRSLRWGLYRSAYKDRISNIGRRLKKCGSRSFMLEMLLIIYSKMMRDQSPQRCCSTSVKQSLLKADSGHAVRSLPANSSEEPTF